ncbi:Sulfite exporter TauE/SafE [Maioricimonas rarisocia]|uniref:Probable membrane transporter protein n=1 Tax=Maioricimonas rarisocia TaxID=2528026 RepID=A0A517ZA43_9PLAN|nr:sulfite exporter TauE/SafE family protein [Maioricimonas rarisocia]QDU39353.1 Sulfite exporter TauE/SafE [Maioricimonas rarisocia]
MSSVIGAILIGLTLGLLGSGGSILTVPVLVYLLGHQDKVAIAESLAIVGGIALAGMIPYARARLIDWRSVVLFGVPGMAGTYAGAWLARFVAGPVQLTLFAGVMLVSAGLMIRSPGEREESDPATDEPHAHPYWMVVLEGLAVGILTGLVGVGGGFLIVPALVLLGGLPMRMAVGTSLVVVALKSFSGFAKYLGVLEGLEMSVDWRTIGLFLVIGIIGSFVGHSIGGRINQLALRRGFAVFLVAMGLFVLGREVPKLADATSGAPIDSHVSLQTLPMPATTFCTDPQARD